MFLKFLKIKMFFLIQVVLTLLCGCCGLQPPAERILTRDWAKEKCPKPKRQGIPYAHRTLGKPVIYDAPTDHHSREDERSVEYR